MSLGWSSGTLTVALLAVAAASALGATVTQIRVTQPRRIGKFTRFATRGGKAPLRLDRCLMPGSTRPVRCPTA